MSILFLRWLAVLLLTCLKLSPIAQALLYRKICEIIIYYSLILRIKTNSNTYFIIDCEPINNYSSSGLIFKVDDEQWFLSNNNPLGLRHLAYHVLGNRGTLSKTMFKKLESKVATFNHVHTESSNWVRNGINNLT